MPFCSRGQADQGALGNVLPPELPRRVGYPCISEALTASDGDGPTTRRNARHGPIPIGRRLATIVVSAQSHVIPLANPSVAAPADAGLSIRDRPLDRPPQGDSDI
jgi:hypothetical protein